MLHFAPTQRLRSEIAERVGFLLMVGAAATTIGCSKDAPPAGALKDAQPRIWVGTAIVGEGDEVAYVDVVIGEKTGPTGTAFASGLANQQAGHPAMVAILQPNVAVKPSTLLVSRVTITGEKAAVQFYDPVRQGVAKAIVDAVAEKTIPVEKADELVMILSVYIHAKAEDKAKLHDNNYHATKLALMRAMAGEPSVADVEKVRRGQ